MAARSFGLREIGTGYFGKEPSEHIADTLRSLVLLNGAELGFEVCLTSRPFTAQTFVAGSPGAMFPGRANVTGENRAQLDLLDAFRLLSEFGFRFAATELSDGLAAIDDRRMLIAGPLRLDDRWCSFADRISFGEVWRYVSVRSADGHDALICFDPVFGGYTRLRRAEVSAKCVIAEGPPEAVDRVAVAKRCLRVGFAFRAEDSSPGRDAEGMLQCRNIAKDLIVGGASHRLKFSLRRQGIYAMRWAGLLGEVGAVGMDCLALADLLRGIQLICRRAHKAVRLTCRPLNAEERYASVDGNLLSAR
jgi:hypothetical protein